MNTKSKEAQFIASVLERAGVTPLIVDLSMKPHDLPTADITGDQVARLAGTSRPALTAHWRPHPGKPQTNMRARKRPPLWLRGASRSCMRGTRMATSLA